MKGVCKADREKIGKIEETEKLNETNEKIEEMDEKNFPYFLEVFPVGPPWVCVCMHCDVDIY